ncbi:hypothetical protein E2C01_091998 [Portunus trituberculatus]|uniref:Uncharacterized protein n=1 Tax=Portunus trituberculatus TaxID=210409 RepID=A0A5B7JKG1_PORTR|nr:hypothetical protein [Portunus trituberculatus]
MLAAGTSWGQCVAWDWPGALPTRGLIRDKDVLITGLGEEEEEKEEEEEEEEEGEEELCLPGT